MGKRLGWLSDQSPIGASVPSLSRAFFARRQLPDSSFVEFVRLPSGPDGPCSLCAALSHLWKEGNFTQIRLLHTREHVLGEFQAVETPACKQGQRAIGQQSGSITIFHKKVNLVKRLQWLSRANPYCSKCSITE